MSLIALLAIAALAGQEPAPDSRDCLDDNGVDRCAAENRARVLAAMGAPAIEAEAAAGVEAYRVLQVDGYGADQPVVAFERRPGASPRVAVYGRDGQVLTGAVPAPVWARVRQAARLADREMVPPPGREEPVNICLHSWVYTFEAADPPNPYARAPEAGAVRRRTEDACGGGLTGEFARMLAEEAIHLIPDCDALDPDQHRNDTARLNVCARFRGDRMAAAQLMNQVGWRAVPDDDPETPIAWESLFGMNSAVRLDWAGEIVQDARGGFPGAPASFLAAKKAEEPTLRGYLIDFDAVSSTRVEVAGRLDREDAEDRTWSAPFRQVWVWNHPGQNWTLQSWTVEPFQPVR